MKKRILVTPLNWGLGHVARSIPIIHALLEQGCAVHLASDGVALHLLKAEFPDLPIYELPTYGVQYHSTNMLRNILPRLPYLYQAVRKEQKCTQKIVEEHHIDGILSDNRYGCYAEDCPSILLTHQLNLQYPNALLENMANWLLHRSLQSFDVLWVPDVAESPNLSGKLSHTADKIHPNIEFVGILSRMKRFDVEKEYDVAVVLSGPEPQRTILEEKLLDQALNLPQRFIFVQGKTHTHTQYYAADHIEVTSYLTSEDLNKVILASDMVVCRSGYSSLMDLAVTGKRALLVPTPGQTEQEYLAEVCSKNQQFVSQNQKEIKLKEGLKMIKSTTGLNQALFSPTAFLPFLKKWLAT